MGGYRTEGGEKRRARRSERKVEAESAPSGPSQPKPKKRLDPGDAPDGYDQTTWTLAIHFQEQALLRKIHMAQGLPVIHNTIRDLVDGCMIRDKVFHQVVEPCTRRFKDGWVDKCWYHYPVRPTEHQVARDLHWPEMVEIIMAEFWSRTWDAQALGYFSQYFEEYGQKCVDHWRSLRILSSLDEAAKTWARPVYRREKPSASMPSDSKEG